MSEVQINCDNITTHVQELKDVRDSYGDERDGIGEAAYDGVGKIADAIQETEESCMGLLDLLDEAYGRSIALLEYTAMTWNDTEETVANAMQRNGC